MAEISIGDVCVQAHRGSLKITSRKHPDWTISLDSESMQALSEFVASYSDPDYNFRRAFRVPVCQHGGLDVRIRIGSGNIPFTPTNISMTGLFAVPSSGQEVPKLAPGDPVQILLQYQEKCLRVRAQVVRIQGNGYGFFFPDSMDGEHISPPKDLVQLVMDLQRQMISTAQEEV